MKVWIVTAGLSYEGAFATAVCSTEEKAEELSEKLKRTTSYDWFGVDGYEVDGHEPDFSHFT